MQSITVTRYPNPKEVGWAGYIEPKDRSWIAFIDRDGRPMVFLHRDPVTGAIMSDDPEDRAAQLEALKRDPASVCTGTIVPADSDVTIAAPVGMVVQPLGCGRIGD